MTTTTLGLTMVCEPMPEVQPRPTFSAAMSTNHPTTTILQALAPLRTSTRRVAIGNVEAVYTLSIFVPFLGALPAVIYAYAVYASEVALGSPAWFYFNETEASVQAHRFATNAGWHYIEPLAAPTNIAFWLSGVLLFVLPWLGDAPLPNQTYGIAMMLSLLGATSYSFHLDGSRTKTWQCYYKTLEKKTIKKGLNKS